MMKTYSYPYLLTWIARLLESRATTGSNQSEEFIAYTELNMSRMARIDKTIQLNDALKAKIQGITKKQTWIVITEAWCGDSAQNLPIIYKMSEENPEMIDLQIVLRDDNLDFIAQYQTNGGNAIPKLIARNEDGADIFTWGPRPQAAVDIYLDWKNNSPDKTKEQFEIELHTWYAKNKGIALQEEFIRLLS